MKNDYVELINAIRSGDSNSFTVLVRKYQNVAFASACALLRDFDLAHDAVQESFLTVFYQLYRLERPESFPAWLNKIVRYKCYRIRRQEIRQIITETEESWDLTAGKTPERILMDKERDDFVINTLNSLPDHLREVVFLFYLEDRSQKEVAEYLGIPKSTVNNRLNSARQKLRRRLVNMAKDALKERRLPDDFADNVATIVRIQGAVVQASLKGEQHPLLFDQWGMLDDGMSNNQRFTVIQREVNGRIRLCSGQQLESIAPGSMIRDMGEQIKTPLSDDHLEEIVSSIALPRPDDSTVLETGIKVIDLMCPLPRRGTVGLLGIQGVGKAVLVKELYHRLKAGDGGLTIFYFASPQEAVSIRSLVNREPGFPADADGALESAWLVTNHATDPEYSKTTDKLDVAIYMSPLVSCRNLYPAIDCLHSSSHLLEPGTAGKEHLEVVQRIHDLLSEGRRISHDPVFCEYVANGAYSRARQRYEKESKRENKSLSKDDQTRLTRLRKLELFMTQPFYVTESYTGVRGVTVSLQETISGCTNILDGAVDDVPTAPFAFKGTLSQIREEAAE